MTGDLFTANTSANADAQAVSLNRIRVETAMSRFPIHRLAKKDTVTINLEQIAENGETDFKWEVQYVQKYGQPGPLAYKLDTLIVNRRIDEAGRPLPGIIKLGSLTQLCVDLGISDSGENRANLKKALHQNASAYITAKIPFRTKTGKDRWHEIGYNRYSVVFTGEVLPDGAVADAVYIVPNTSYRNLLNQVERRPLDYDYLKSLTPGAQRFYELASFQIFGSLAGGRPRAKMLYSDYCKFAPQNRYFEFDQVKKQMFKIHAPHREAGYIAKVDYQTVSEEGGEPDWEIFYTPGSKAIAEYQTFTRRQVRQAVEHSPLPLPAMAQLAATAGNDRGEGAEEGRGGLLDQLVDRGIAKRAAKELLEQLRPGQEVLDQLEYVDLLVANDSRGKLENPPGLYIKYLRDNIQPPADFVGSRKRLESEKANWEKSVNVAMLDQQKAEYDRYCEAETLKYIADVLPAAEYNAVHANMLVQNRPLFPYKTTEELAEISHITARSEIREQQHLTLESFEDFISMRTPASPMN